jgi:putative tryptophan/tyrosine transport system substrate-binding protein
LTRSAARLYRLAANQGNAAGRNNLGFFYANGRGGLSQNDQEAVRLYRLAANQGNAAGRNNLGFFYANGRGGLTQNDQEAARFYRLAANQGNVFAEVSLGFFYETGRGGLPKDDREAARLYRLAAEQNDPIGQNKLATFYEEGRGGLRKDNRESARLYKLAAEQDRNLNKKQQASDAVIRLGLAYPVASGLAPTGVPPAIPVIGFLGWSSPIPNADVVVAFRRGLAETGYVEGENVAIEYRWANGQTARMPALALELVRRQVSVLVPVQATSATRAAKAATSSIPIVFAYGGDPVRDNIVASLNRPEGNLTGVTDINTELGGKRLSLLRDLIPQAATVGFLSGAPNYLLYEEQKGEILDAARLLGRRIDILETRSDREYEATFAKLIEHQVGGLVVGAFTFSNTNKILALAALHKIPTIYPFRSYVDAGGLMSYGSVNNDIFRQVGIYTGRILKGAKPADLPVMTPVKFELVINLKTAKALGINIPETLLATADEMIE